MGLSISLIPSLALLVHVDSLGDLENSLCLYRISYLQLREDTCSWISSPCRCYRIQIALLPQLWADPATDSDSVA